MVCELSPVHQSLLLDVYPCAPKAPDLAVAFASATTTTTTTVTTTTVTTTTTAATITNAMTTINSDAYSAQLSGTNG